MKRTIITHFYNEEYLLPWFLEYHKQHFDDGILIDYHSTDRSVEICKDICPNWKVFTSGNKDFGAYMLDQEVMHYEKQFEGWRIALNVTEFLVGNLDKLMHDRKEATQYLIPAISFFDWDPEGSLDQSKSLWEQKTKGISYKTDFQTRRARSLHNVVNVQYPLGRHFEKYDCEDALIFHYANCISSPEMVKRRLQIQERIPEGDKRMNLGHQHHNAGKGLTIESLYKFNIKENSKVNDWIQFITEFMQNESIDSHSK